MNAMTTIVAKRPEVEFRKGETTRLQPIRAFKAVSRLMADKEDTAAVFDLMRALAGKALPNGYARLLKTPRGGRIAYERDELNDRLMDRAWLESFAPRTVGAAYLAHLVQGPVRRYDVPGIHAINLVCERALGGGGMASLRNDPLGKGMAQMLLDMPVEVPQSLL